MLGINMYLGLFDYLLIEIFCDILEFYLNYVIFLIIVYFLVIV